MTMGKLYGVGVGPGDPELLTLKAVRALQHADVVAHFCKRGASGNAWRSAQPVLQNSAAEVLPLVYPYTTERSPRDPQYVRALRGFYDEAAEQISTRLRKRKTVAVVCEGDPLFYGSYMYIHDRLAGHHPTEVVPGVTSFVGCAANARIPMVSTDRTFTVLPGTLPEEVLERRVRQADAFAVIKIGRHLPKLKRVLQRAGQLADATYIERGTMGKELIQRLSAVPDTRATYFSLVVVPGHDGGPYRPLAEVAVP